MNRLIELADAAINFSYQAACGVTTFGKNSELVKARIEEQKAARAALVAEIERVERDAARYQWIRMRLRVKKMKAVSGSVRDAINVRVGCSFLDSGLPHTIPETYPEEQAQKLDVAIDAAIDAMKEQTL